MGMCGNGDPGNAGSYVAQWAEMTLWGVTLRRYGDARI